MRIDWRVWLTASIVWVVAACHRTDRASHEPSAVCVLKVPAHLAHESPSELPARFWFELLFKGYREGIGSDPVDCSGEPIVWGELPTQCAEQEPVGDGKRRPDELASGPATVVIVRHLEGAYWIAWAPFRRLDNGMHEGPIAIARLYEGALEARAVGTLRAFAEKVRLQVRQLGREHILVAEGEWCSTPEACTRGTRLMWLDRQRFRARPVRSATLRSCLGPAWFQHAQVLEKKLGAHWSRTLKRAAVLSYAPSHVSMQERIVVYDRDLERPALPPRLFRDAQAQLTLTLQGGELLSEGQSLWSAINAEDSLTEAMKGRSP